MALELPENLRPIEPILEGEQAPFSGVIMTREVLEAYEVHRLGHNECKNEIFDCTKNDSSNLIAGSITGAVVVLLLCWAGHCRF